MEFEPFLPIFSKLYAEIDYFPSCEPFLEVSKSFRIRKTVAKSQTL